MKKRKKKDTETELKMVMREKKMVKEKLKQIVNHFTLNFITTNNNGSNTYKYKQYQIDHKYRRKCGLKRFKI